MRIRHRFFFLRRRRAIVVVVVAIMPLACIYAATLQKIMNAPWKLHNIDVGKWKEN